MIPTPFTNIALSLSGGGYRATTFHLGAMGYLDSQNFKGNNLLHNVKIISTISGGTITGVMYAHKLANGGDYQDCFDKLYKLLSEDELIEQAFHKLNHPSQWRNKHKSRDVINAFAEVYNENFFDAATFAELFDSKPQHLTDAIFGTSEFTYGIQFRLQQNENNARFGNGYLNLPDDVAKEIRLADATAASSCFPGGFEPMIMPNDFGNGPESAVDKTWKSKSYEDVPYPPTAIMDGGIIDNQGIEGVKLAEERGAKREGKPFIGTYIVSDVCSEKMKPYEVPLLKYVGWKNWITVERVSASLLLLSILLIAGLISGLPFWGIITSSVILTVILLYYVVLFSVRGGIRSALAGSFGADAVPEMMDNFGVIKKTPIYILMYLIKFRVTSVVTMVSDVFLRRIRRLQLETLYRDDDWNYRFKSNYIYSLTKQFDKLTPAMQKVIKMANSMPTTLWFTSKEKKDNMLDNLIAAGQITVCFNLIKYAKRMKKGNHEKKVWNALSVDDQKAIAKLQTSMEADWEKFLVDPYWLLNQQKKIMNLA